jgi:hypothetical protein
MYFMWCRIYVHPHSWNPVLPIRILPNAIVPNMLWSLSLTPLLELIAIALVNTMSAIPTCDVLLHDEQFKVIYLSSVQVFIQNLAQVCDAT